MTEEITDDELFAQITINMRKISDAIQSHEAQIKRLQFRIDRLEKRYGALMIAAVVFLGCMIGGAAIPL